MEYVLQGKKGNGKGIVALRMIERYLQEGKPVATNMNLFLEHLLPPESKTFVYRLPDQPTSADMEALGTNPTGGDEAKNGLIVLDECASWLNSREYKDKERHKLIDWFLHSRKHGWDVVYIIQSINMLDKQFRDGFAEHLITAQRLDRLPIPIIGGLVSLFGFASRMPRVHVGTVRYGTMSNAPVVERIYARGKRFWKAYDTLQRFSNANEYQALSCTLPAYHVYGRYNSRFDMYKKIVGGSILSGLLSGFMLTLAVGVFMGYERPKVDAAASVVTDPVYISGYALRSGVLYAVLPNGKSISTSSYRIDSSGVEFVVGSQLYKAVD